MGFVESFCPLVRWNVGCPGLFRALVPFEGVKISEGRERSNRRRVIFITYDNQNYRIFWKHKTGKTFGISRGPQFSGEPINRY